MTKRKIAIKKQIARLLVFVLFAAIFSGCQGDKVDNVLTFTLSQDGSYYEAKANRDDNLETQSITVPATYEGKPVALAQQAFYGLPKLQTVTVEGIVGTVPNQAFANCPMLKAVILKGDATVDSRCFTDCNSLKSIIFGTVFLQLAPSVSAIARSCRRLSSEIHLPANVVMEQYVFNHLAWNEAGGYSMCKAVYFYATEPTAENLGINAIGYTWDRNTEDDPELGAFKVYVPEEAEDLYIELIEKECDESWTRCVLNQDKLATFVTDN